jgi:hypothetical protein
VFNGEFPLYVLVLLNKRGGPLKYKTSTISIRSQLEYGNEDSEATSSF